MNRIKGIAAALMRYARVLDHGNGVFCGRKVCILTLPEAFV